MKKKNKIRKVLIIKQAGADQEKYLDFIKLLRDFLLGKTKITFLDKADKIFGHLKKEVVKTTAIIFVGQAMIPSATLAGEEFPKFKIIIFAGRVEEIIAQKNNVFILSKKSEKAFVNALEIINY
jgi:hypothetical protein